jgi:hypothetical protein
VRLRVPDAPSSVARPAWRRRGPVLLSGTGLFGEQISELLLLFSIVTTADMAGLSSGHCCTQRSPTSKHLCSLGRSSGAGWATAESRRSSISCWFQDSQACKRASFMKKKEMGASAESVDCPHVRKELCCGSVPLAAQYLQYNDSEAINVALQRQVPLQCILWGNVAPSINTN